MRLALRIARLVTAILIAAALTYQFGKSAQIETFDPINFFFYFTVLSNIAAAVLLAFEAVRPAAMSSPGSAVVRGAVTLYMAVTGLVYAVLLAPQAADVAVTSRWVDFVVHVVAPIVVVADWFVDPPRSRPTVAEAALWLVFPLVFLVVSLVRGPIVDWYPYPFLDPDENAGYGGVALTSLGILVVFLGIAAALRWWAGRRQPVAVG